MRDRCFNPKHPWFHRYGGRGIGICARWSEFKNFLADMGEAPTGLQLDRIDNDCGYEPLNCQWTTRSVQSCNRRTSRMLTANGKTQNVATWAKELGMSRQVLRHRLEAGWTPEQAVSMSVDYGNARKMRRR